MDRPMHHKILYENLLSSVRTLMYEAVTAVVGNKPKGQRVSLQRSGPKSLLRCV